MEKKEGRGGAEGKVLRIVEEAKTKTAAGGKAAVFRAKRGGVIPRKRRLVKTMMWNGAVNCVRFALASCFCSSEAGSEPVRAKKTRVGDAEVLPLPGKH